MLSRRSLLVGGSIASVGTAVSVRAIEGQGNLITIFDSRIMRSRMFAEARLGKIIDVAQNPVSLWSACRNISESASVAGFTRWSDFVGIRGQLESAGFRVRHFKKQRDLIDWLMA